MSKTGDRQGALAMLEKGFKVADDRGDRMPRDAMSTLIQQLGGVPPQAAKRAAAAVASGEGVDFNCSRCGKPSPKMASRPFRGPLGEKVWANVCQACWREWIGMGTKVINEMGLQLADPRSQGIYDEHMKEFLQIMD
jgi:Fe-S cluster biosynthesis and repair protein YggX